MWRKGADAEVLCNSCGLKQLKGGKGADNNSDNSGPKNGTGKAANGTGSQFVGRVRKSARLKPSKYKFQAATKALATKGKNRRVIFKKNVRKLYKQSKKPQAKSRLKPQCHKDVIIIL